ncbi:DUF58 domain-containing protein [Boudabousia marimammalium]|uniref:DUF58 domain-containing protein n=1 Tax=Boudabousia marimammalium TaxID=156892 RepID=A0A1Q5PRM5_9ACTO|nr:DUF58 domain-containing protein [Boudabousia marimammalium]OKL50206.1 hypothetical protein BM477_02090 [Boudabousia marimammalium]
MYLTPLAILYTALGLIPLLLVPSVWTLIVWIVVGGVLVLVDLWLAHSPQLLTVERTTSQSTRLDSPARSTLTLRNPTGEKYRGQVRDAWPPSAQANHPVHSFHLDAQDGSRVVTELLPSRRGTVTAGPITIRSRGPLGLAGRQVSLVSPAQVLVLPPFYARRHLPSRLQRLNQINGSTPLINRGAGSEFDSLREYVRGDDIRDIDWRATARSRDLMVRTWRPERDQDVIIINDSSRNSAPRIDGFPRLEAQIETALLLAALSSHAGDKVHYLDVESSVRARVTGVGAKQIVHAIAVPAASIDATLGEINWNLIPHEVSRLTSHSALVVILTSVDSTSLDSGLMQAVVQLTERHKVILASAVDTKLKQMALGEDPETDLYESAAAQITLLNSQGVKTEFASLGAYLVEGSAEELPPLVADKYLLLKSMGAL